MYHAAMEYLGEHPVYRGNDHAARRAKPDYIECTLREWQTVFAQAWYDKNGIEGRFQSAPNRIIMPVDTCLCLEWRYIRYGGVTKGDLVWEGVDTDVWQSFHVIPGNLVSVTECRDEKGNPYYMMGVLCYVAHVRNMPEFVDFLLKGITKGGKRWIRDSIGSR